MFLKNEHNSELTGILFWLLESLSDKVQYKGTFPLADFHLAFAVSEHMLTTPLSVVTHGGTYTQSGILTMPQCRQFSDTDEEMEERQEMFWDPWKSQPRQQSDTAEGIYFVVTTDFRGRKTRGNQSAKGLVWERTGVSGQRGCKDKQGIPA